MLELTSGKLRLTVDPERGASIRAFDIQTESGSRPILAPSCPDPQNAGQSALFPMAPFANRVRDNRLDISGRDVELTPNTVDPLCLHGWAWQRPWHVAHQASDRCLLSLHLSDHGYNLTLGYELTLSNTSLRLDLWATNTGTHAVPVGLGFHPYFPRRPDTVLRFEARTFWPDGPGHLPTGRTAVPDSADFARGCRLPDTWRNDCFSGWAGAAFVSQAGLGYDLTLTSPDASVLMFYADPALDRFAVEPQTHVSGETHTGPNGLLALPPNQECRITMMLSVDPQNAGQLPEGLEHGAD